MSDDDGGTSVQVQRLTQQLAKLQAQLDTLTATVEALHFQREATLKSQLRCPACGGRRALHASEILDRTDSKAGQMSITSVGFWAPKPQGVFECYVCLGCGFAEWYVKDPAGVDTNEKLRLVEAAEDVPGPYR